MTTKLPLHLYHVRQSRLHGYVYGCYDQTLAEDYIILARSKMEARILLRRHLGLEPGALYDAYVTEHELPTTPTVLVSACEGAQYYSEEYKHYSQTYGCTLHASGTKAQLDDYRQMMDDALRSYCADQGIAYPDGGSNAT